MLTMTTIEAEAKGNFLPAWGLQAVRLKSPIRQMFMGGSSEAGNWKSAITMGLTFKAALRGIQQIQPLPQG